MKNYIEESGEKCFFEVDIHYLEKLQYFLHNDFPFLPERMNIEKGEKFVVNLYDKTEYVIHIRHLK